MEDNPGHLVCSIAGPHKPRSTKPKFKLINFALKYGSPLSICRQTTSTTSTQNERGTLACALEGGAGEFTWRCGGRPRPHPSQVTVCWVRGLRRICNWRVLKPERPSPNLTRTCSDTLQVFYRFIGSDDLIYSKQTVFERLQCCMYKRKSSK